MQEVYRCPKCNGSQTRFRVRTNDRMCYICGYSWRIEIEEEKIDG